MISIDFFIDSCWSSIGRSGGKQRLSLGKGCERKGVALHELMHVLGFFHEQSRLDREKYVTVYLSNVDKGKVLKYVPTFLEKESCCWVFRINFTAVESPIRSYFDCSVAVWTGQFVWAVEVISKPFHSMYLTVLLDQHYNFQTYSHGEADPLDLPYDYGSIMHYPKDAFSSNGNPTIVPKDRNAAIGQRVALSKIDIKKINKFYKCSSFTTASTTTEATTTGKLVTTRDWILKDQ